MASSKYAKKDSMALPAPKNSGIWESKMSNGVGACWKCGILVYEKSSWKHWPQGATCLKCRVLLENAKQEYYTKKFGENYFHKVDPTNDHTDYTEYVEKKMAPTPTKTPMVKGEIKKLPKDHAPLWSDQWAVMGSGKSPYIVTHKPMDKQKELQWQCSCPSWTQHTPREDCKHILTVKLKEKVSLIDPDKPQYGKVFVLPQETTIHKDAGNALKTFEQKGRKFR